MRKSAVLLATMALTVLLASGVALAATFRGTDGNDTIVGTEKADQIFGLGGKDDLEGRGGGDVIHAGPGIDRGSGEDGNDTIYLGPGNDGEALPPNCSPSGVCFGSNRGDYAGGLGKDVMYGGAGDDEMVGDRVVASFYSDFSGGADIMYGEGGNDFMDGDAGSNTLYGGAGRDILATTNNEYSEVWYGGTGDDRLIRAYTAVFPGVAESDTFYGGDGDDRFLSEGEVKGDLFYAGDGNDSFGLYGEVVGSGKHRIYCGSGRDTVVYDPSREDIVTHDCEKVTRY